MEGVTVAGRPWEAGRLREAPDRGGRRKAGSATTHYTTLGPASYRPDLTRLGAGIKRLGPNVFIR